MLPNDYQEFLLTHNGGKFESNAFFVIPELERKVQLEYLHGFDYDIQSATDLEKSYGFHFNDEMTGEKLAIGICKTEKGYLILMTINIEEVSGIYVCDVFYDDFALEESSESNNAYYITNIFNDFLSKLTDN